MMDFSKATKALVQAQLSTSVNVIYAAPNSPVNAQTVIRSLWICNTDVAPRKVTLRYAGATAVNSILDQALLPGSTSWFIDSPSVLTMSAGTTLQGMCDVGAKVTVTISGEEFL